MGFLLVILNPSGYDDTSSDSPKPRRLPDWHLIPSLTQVNQDFSFKLTPSFVIFLTCFHPPGSHLPSIIRKCCRCHLEIFFPSRRNTFTTLHPVAFPDSSLVTPWLSLGEAFIVQETTRSNEFLYLLWGQHPHPAQVHLVTGKDGS